MRNLFQDLRYALRMLAKNPGFTFVAVLTLALGIGASTAIFSVVNGVLLRPLPYKDPDRVMMVYKYSEGQESRAPTISGPDFLDCQQRSQLFESFAAITGGSVSLTGNAAPEQVNMASVTPNFFKLFGVEPLLGRHFLPEETVATGHAPVVAIISHALWQRRYGGDPALLDSTIQIGGNAIPVVGILPEDFKLHLPPNAFLLKDADVWIPGHWDLSRSQRTNNFLTAFGRLKPGVALGQAQAEMDNICAQLKEEHSELNRDALIRVTPLHTAIVKDVEPTLLMLLGAVGFVLLIACANVANLSLARTTARGKEIAIRAALGASRARLIRQTLAESFLISLCGGVAGLLLTYWALELLLTLQPANLSRLESVAIDGRVLAFAIAVCFLSPLVSGLPSALRASRISPMEALKEGGRTSAATDRKGLRRLLIIGELALSLALLIGGGLLLQTFASLQSVPLGFNPENVLTFQATPPFPRYGRLGQDRNATFYRQLEERLALLPGVEAVGTTSQIPFTGTGHWAGYSWDGESRQGRPDLVADWRFVTPDYFRVVETRLMAGRFFTEQDGADRPNVVIVDAALAQKAWPGEDPIGKKLLLPYSAPGGIRDVWMEVVGVIEPVRNHKLTEYVREQFYIPYAQNAAIPNMIVAVRTKSDKAALVHAIEKEVQAIDKEIPVYKVRMMDEYVSDAMAPTRFSLTLIGIFGAVALVLASVGLYGVISYSVTRRTQEIGIRAALGAESRDIFKLVLGEALALTLIGIGVGLVMAFALTRFLASLLFGVSPTDPLTFAAVSALLIAVALLACFIPARRATKVDPIVALRCE